MHQLILLRHAKAVRGDATQTDHDRALAPEGERAAAAMGAAMRRIGLTPDVVLVSSSRRTLQTLAALEPWDERPNIETMPGLYMASAPQIREVLRGLPETVRSVLVVGHNPGIHELAQLLAGDPRNYAGKHELQRLEHEYPTGTLTEFLITTLWHKLGPSTAVLKRVLEPADLRSAGT